MHGCWVLVGDHWFRDFRFQSPEYYYQDIRNPFLRKNARDMNTNHQEKILILSSTFTLWKIFLSKRFPTSVLFTNDLSISITNFKSLVTFNSCLLTSSVSYVVSRLQIPILDRRMIANDGFASGIDCWIIRIPWSVSTFNRRWSYLKRWHKC